MISLCLVVLGTQVLNPTATLQKYLDGARTPSSVVVAKGEAGPTHLKLVSQKWHGETWTHDVMVDYPNAVLHKKMALLFVTGGKPNEADLSMTKSLAQESGMPVVTLYQIPNQPLFGRNEDDLIAHTFEQYLRTGDETWPLLFPMVKSVHAAMDAVIPALKETPTPVTQFVIFGASKRGWTTWLSAATGDSRIAGIAPQVFDNLNFHKQLPHQLQQWGTYSEMIGDYTKRGLQDVLNSEPGKKLVSLVDPYSYLPGISCPVLIINGANDRYWPVDALSLYSGAIRSSWACSIVPNEGHLLGDQSVANSVLVAFAAACAGEFKFAQQDVKLQITEKAVHARSASKLPVTLSIWTASSDSTDFRDSRWGPHIARTKHSLVSAPVIASDKNTAVMAIANFEVGKRKFQLTSPVTILKRKALGR